MAMHSFSALPERLAGAVWRADSVSDAASAVVASGHAALDAQLPGGGWPLGALCEILQAHAGLGEWRLLLPALRGLTQQVVLVGAPYMPFGPGLAAQGLDTRALLWVKVDAAAERLWAAEQALRCAEVAALLLWLPQARADQLRRLHLAAQAQAKLLFVMRPVAARDESSPAVLRVLLGASSAGIFEGQHGQVAARCAMTPSASRPVCASGRLGEACGDGLTVQILKRRGPPLAQPLVLVAQHAQLSATLDQGQTHRRHRSGRGLEQLHALDCLDGAA